MRKRYLFLALLGVLFISGCSGGNKDAPVKEESSEKQEESYEVQSTDFPEVEEKIEAELKDKYDKYFDIYYLDEFNIEEIDVNYSGYAYVDKDTSTSISVDLLKDGTLLDNYSYQDYIKAMEDIAYQSSSDITFIHDIKVTATVFADDKKYKDTEDYMKTGNYTVSIELTTDKDFDPERILRGLVIYETRLSDSHLNNRVTINKSVSLNFDFDNEFALDEDEILQTLESRSGSSYSYLFEDDEDEEE